MIIYSGQRAYHCRTNLYGSGPKRQSAAIKEISNRSTQLVRIQPVFKDKPVETLTITLEVTKTNLTIKLKKSTLQRREARPGSYRFLTPRRWGTSSHKELCNPNQIFSRSGLESHSPPVFLTEVTWVGLPPCRDSVTETWKRQYT